MQTWMQGQTPRWSFLHGAVDQSRFSFVYCRWHSWWWLVNGAPVPQKKHLSFAWGAVRKWIVLWDSVSNKRLCRIEHPVSCVKGSCDGNSIIAFALSMAMHLIVGNMRSYLVVSWNQSIVWLKLTYLSCFSKACDAVCHIQQSILLLTVSHTSA